MTQLLRIGIALALIVGISGCEIQFEPQLTPLDLPTIPPQPFQGEIETSGTELPTVPANTITPAAGFGEFTSSQAIELCKRVELVGDEQVGSCLAPGGETYFVWVSPTQMLEVPRDSAFLNNFRIAADDRSEALGALQDVVRSGWWDIPALGITTIGLSVCVAGAVPGPQQPLLLLGCGLDIAGWLGSGVKLANDANNFVNAVITFYDKNVDAGYNFCRMEGGSDGECR